MAKKVEKNTKKPVKTPVKEVKPVVKEEPKKEVKAEPKKEPAKKTRPVGIIKKTVSKKKTPPKKFEETKNLDKLYVFFTIVNSGIGSNIVSIFEDMGSSVSIIHSGMGTATEQIRNALHIVDNKKEVVISIIRESRLDDVEKEIAAFFMAAKRNKGISFAVQMDSIQGVRVYKFLSQTL